MDSDLTIDAEDPAHHLRDKAEVMGDGKYGDPVCQLLEDLEKLEMGSRVDIGGGFIKEQDLGLADQGPGNENALALTAGQAVEGAIGQIIHRQFGAMRRSSALYRHRPMEPARPISTTSITDTGKEGSYWRYWGI